LCDRTISHWRRFKGNQILGEEFNR